MGIFNRKKQPDAVAAEVSPSEKNASTENSAIVTPRGNLQSSLPIRGENIVPEEALKKQPITPFAVVLGAIASIGGFMFGYESGEISGKPLIQLCRTGSYIYSRFLADE